MVRVAEGGVQYTIRGVPGEVDRVLRERARAMGKSLNQVVVEELTRVAVGEPKRASFTDLVGQWVPDAGFDEVIEAQRQIDGEKWK
jgi:hypothetical protein